MSTGPCSAYDKWNISVIIVTQILYNGQPSHSGDHNIFGVMTSPLPRVCRSCSTSGTRRVNLVTNKIITRERVRDREVLTISGTNKWSL